MLKHLTQLFILISLVAPLSACFLFAQEHTDYTESEVCKGLKSELMYNAANSNISSGIAALNRSRIMQQMKENNC